MQGNNKTLKRKNTGMVEQKELSISEIAWLGGH